MRVPRLPSTKARDERGAAWDQTEKCVHEMPAGTCDICKSDPQMADVVNRTRPHLTRKDPV